MASTGQGPASSTVTRSTLPSSRKRWVIPSFLARIAGIVVLPEGQPDLDVDARGQMVEPLERVDRLRRRLVDVDQALVRPDLEVLLRVLVLEGGPDHRVAVLLRRQRHGTGHRRAGARGGLHDLLGSRLYGRRVVGLEADSNFVLLGCCHVSFCALRADPRVRGPLPWSYRMWLLDDFGDDAGADGAAALANREAQAGIHGDRLDQLDGHLDVVTGHHHLRALGQVG